MSEKNEYEEKGYIEEKNWKTIFKSQKFEKKQNRSNKTILQVTAVNTN